MAAGGTAAPFPAVCTLQDVTRRCCHSAARTRLVASRRSGRARRRWPCRRRTCGEGRGCDAARWSHAAVVGVLLAHGAAAVTSVDHYGADRFFFCPAAWHGRFAAVGVLLRQTPRPASPPTTAVGAIRVGGGSPWRCTACASGWSAGRLTSAGRRHHRVAWRRGISRGGWGGTGNGRQRRRAARCDAGGGLAWRAPAAGRRRLGPPGAVYRRLSPVDRRGAWRRAAAGCCGRNPSQRRPSRWRSSRRRSSRWRRLCDTGTTRDRRGCHRRQLPHGTRWYEP